MLGIFDRKEEVTLTTDTSEHAVAAMKAPEIYPVIYLSRKLTAAETN